MNCRRLSLLVITVSLGSLVVACSPKSSDAGVAKRATNAQQGAESPNPEGTNITPKTPKTPKNPQKTTPARGDEKTPIDVDADKPATDAQCYKGDAAICAAEFKIFELTNKVRAGRGLQPFIFSPKISFVARGWSKDQAQSSFISHAGFPNRRTAAYSQEFSTKFNANAENVAMTGRSSSPADDFVNMWVGSRGHLRNMLGNYKALGVGVAQSSNGGWYATQIFGDE